MSAAPGEWEQQLMQRAAQLAQSGRPDEAAALYRRVLAASPDHPEATHFLGGCLVQSGDPAGGFALLARSAQLDPRRVMFRQNHAALLAQIGDFASAERELLAAIALEPGNAVLHKFLGMVRQQLGRFTEAAEAFRAALALTPQDLSLAAAYGHCLLEAGDIDAALACLRQVTEREPRNAFAQNLVGMAHRARGDLHAAIACFRQAGAADPRHAGAWNNLGLALRQLGDRAGSFDALHRAVKADPGFAPAWQEFARAFESVSFERWDAELAGEMAAILRHPGVEASGVAGAAGRLLALNADSRQAAQDLAAAGSAARAWLRKDRLEKVANPLFLALVENFFAPTPAFERMMHALRQCLLELWREGALQRSPLMVELACALAQQCFLNEYVWPPSEAERAIAERLAERARGEADVLELALLAACRPLTATAGLPRPAAGGDPFDRLWRRQVDEPAEEARLRADIARMTPIEDATSLAVRRQYEENPYPRWHRFPASALVPRPLRLELEMLFPHLDSSRLGIPDSPAILVAGCGSGFHAATAAARYAQGRVLAVDLSLTSLAYATRRCRELGLRNVRFAQADILRLADLPERFDVIESAGVLHHLDDPLAGWRVLASLLRPGGVMKIALYSEIARRSVVAARELIAGHGLAGDLAGIRAARELILAQAEDSPARGVTRFSDFFSASGARDLMLHVREHRFTASRIEQCLAALGLEFLGFEIDAPGVIPAYQASFPDDPAMISLANWGRFEEQHPDTFASMYQFRVLKPRA